VSRVIQIRDVPDEVHESLSESARAAGLSLNRYVLGELEHLARRSEVAAGNAEVIRRTRARVTSRVARETILTALHQGREE
jgi:hypothetical protein